MFAALSRAFCRQKGAPGRRLQAPRRGQTIPIGTLPVHVPSLMELVALPELPKKREIAQN
jgi:hypothetical protein